MHVSLDPLIGPIVIRVPLRVEFAVFPHTIPLPPRKSKKELELQQLL